MDYDVLTWMVLLIIFIVVELVSVGLTSIWFAAGALAALILALFGAPPVAQFLVFVAVSVVLLAATRPWARKFINSNTHPTNADSLVGERIRIAERVSNFDQTGMAVVHGQEWTVRAQNDNEIIEEGQFARILSISGVKLIVAKEQIN
jgi:membrane protein implicated in regulation of membrane protease activity